MLESLSFLGGREKNYISGRKLYKIFLLVLCAIFLYNYVIIIIFNKLVSYTYVRINRLKYNKYLIVKNIHSFVMLTKYYILSQTLY